MIKLLVQETDNEVTRENMKRVQKEFTQTQKILNGQWKFFELVFTDAVTNLLYPHKLNFVPKDIIQTSLIGGETVIWNYELFDFTNLNITVTGACTVRAFVGSYLESGGQL